MKKPPLFFITSVSSIGSLLEMYDFAIYAIFAGVLGKLFFPDSSHYLALLQVYAIFAIGYLSRPIGGVIFGSIGDRFGRRLGLMLSMIFMGLPIFLIGCLPTYAHIGAWAPILLLSLRFISGISVGGEFPSGTAYLSEHASSTHRGLTASFLFFGINLGIVLASFVGLSLTSHLTHEHLLRWGWRVPFLLGGVLAVIGLLIRARMSESPVFLQQQKDQQLMKSPVLALMHHESRQVTRAFALICLMSAVISLVFLFMPVYLHTYVKMSTDDAFLFNTINLVIFTCLIPVFGWLSDKTGRNFILGIAAFAFLFLSLPLYQFMITGSKGIVLFCLLCLGVFSAMMIGPIAATMSERFRVRYRTSGIGLSYNIAFGLVGGLAPIAATFLIHLTTTLLAPAFYLMLTAMVSLVAIVNMRDFSRVPLDVLEKRLAALADNDR